MQESKIINNTLFSELGKKSSQICSKCGNKKQMKLNERIYICECGNNIDRDINTAINIKNEGLSRLLEVV
ncbi:zinc ribbon domain-containing protein [Gemelliphila asaccharolytica]